MGRLPRSAFTPAINEPGVYLHLYNRLTLDVKLGDAEKQYFLNLLKNTLQLYSIECLSAVVIQDSYHLVLYVPKEAQSLQKITTLLKHNEQLPGDDYAQRRYEVSNKLSHFMNELQRNFTVWYNKTRLKHRYGALWQSRYKCLKLLDSTSLIHCIKYIELAPVRTQLSTTPDEYNYSTFGISKKTSIHPFAESFLKHMNKAFAQNLNFNSLIQVIQDDFSRLLNGKATTLPDKTKIKRLLAKKNKPVLLQSSRLWTDSVALGSREKLREYASVLWGPERAKKKKFGKVISNKECEIYSMRQLQTNIFS
jgi:hypothetical protein